MSEFVAHGRRRDAEYVAALGGSAETGETAANAHETPIRRRIIADEIGIQTERCQTGRRADQKVPGDREQIDEDDVDVPVIIPRIGRAVRTVVVEQPHINIEIGLFQDFQIELAEPAQRARQVGQVGGSGLARTVAFGQHLSVHPQQAAGHLVIEVGEAAGTVPIEQVRRPGWGLVDARGFSLELGEDHQRAQAADRPDRRFRETARLPRTCPTGTAEAGLG